MAGSQKAQSSQGLLQIFTDLVAALGNRSFRWLVIGFIAVNIPVGVGGVLLDLIKWPTGEGIRTAADVPPETLTQLAILAGPLVASAFIPFFFCIRHSGIDRTRHAEIRTELALK